MPSFLGASVVAGAVTLALLTGCSGGNIAGPTVGGATGPASLHRLLLPGMPTHGTGAAAAHPFINYAAMAKNKGPTIAISLVVANVVDLFSAAGSQVGQLTGFDSPSGLASDNKGDLYVADTGNSRVQIYAARFESPPTTLSDAGQHPFDVDSFHNGAYVAVANISTTLGGPGSVSIFKGSTLQSNITDSNLDYAYFCAFDGKGNLYVDGVDSNDNVVIGEIPDATSGGSTFEQLNTTNSFGQAAGIQVTTAGQIAIEDLLNNVIYTYNPPSEGSLGTPTQITPLGESDYPSTFAFTKTMNYLYTASGANGGVAYEYAYPSGGTPILTIGVGSNTLGTAVIPTQYPGSSR